MKKNKKCETIKKEKERQKTVRKSGLVDKVILGGLGDKYAVIRKYNPDIIALGYDQNFFVDQLKQKIKTFKIKTEIVRLQPFKPERYKTSLLKK